MDGQPPDQNLHGLIYILHGDDEVAIDHFIHQHTLQLGDKDMAVMNTMRLDGRNLGEHDLSNAVMPLPFFTSKRLVIVDDPLAKFESRRGENSESSKETGKNKILREKFLAVLTDLPETTELILIIEDHQKWRAGETYWEVLTSKHFLVKWALEHHHHLKFVGCPIPSQSQMPGWIQKKAIEMRGKFTLQAASELANYVHSDTRLAIMEIEKLLTYCGDRQVEAEDVMAISTSVASADIWDLINAIGQKDIRGAQRLFHQLMETLDLRQEIFPMIIWQFRQLLLAKEVVEEGGTINTIASKLHVAEFQAKRISDQIKNFSFLKLKWVYMRLMEIEEASKGGPEGETSVDISVLIDQFIVELGR